MKKTGLFLALALTACTDGSTTQYTGHNTYEYFPMEGDRTWTYVADTDATSPKRAKRCKSAGWLCCTCSMR